MPVSEGEALTNAPKPPADAPIHNMGTGVSARVAGPQCREDAESAVTHAEYAIERPAGRAQGALSTP
jgi:hypothetical protein